LTRTGVLTPSKADVFNLKDILSVLAESTNPLFAALSILGLLTSFRKTTFPAVAPYAALTVLYLAFLNSSLIPRYVIFLMPMLCLFAAKLIGGLLFAPRRMLRIFGLSSLVLAIFISLLQDLAVIQMLHSDTRARAGAYVAEHLPAAADVKFVLAYSTGDECDFWISSAEMGGWDAERMPDILILEESAFSPEGDLDRFGLVSPVHYSLLKRFDPLWPVKVEYVSPTVWICGRGQ
jgi:uncharacterized protein YjeT (DUF2065 family)